MDEHGKLHVAVSKLYKLWYNYTDWFPALGIPAMNINTELPCSKF